METTGDMAQNGEREPREVNTLLIAWSISQSTAIRLRITILLHSPSSDHRRDFFFAGACHVTKEKLGLYLGLAVVTEVDK